MKKAIALLVAIATVFSLGVVAYADGGFIAMDDNNMTADTTPSVVNDNTGDTGIAGANDEINDIAGANDGVLTLPDTNVGGVSGFAGNAAGGMGAGIGTFSLDWESGVSEDYLTIAKDDMFLVWSEGDNKGQVVSPDSILTPGNSYTFNIYKAGAAVTVGDSATESDFVTKANGTPVVKSDLADGKLRNRIKGASGLVSVSIDDRGSGNNTRYNLEVTVREQFNAKLSDIEFTVSVAGGTSALNASSNALRIGFATMDDDDIDSYSEGDVITIYNDAPVITAKQFQRLARAYNYKAITFEGEDGTWNYTARVSGNGDINFYNTEQIVEDVVIKLADQDFKFVNFHAGMKFATNGEMRIDVSDVYPEFDRMYTYLYRNGTLTPIATSYDSNNNELVFRSNYLGTFVVTNTEITDLAILQPTEPEVAPEEQPEVEEPEVPEVPTTGGNNNPATGMDAAMSMLTTLGLAALSGGGLIRKRK